MIFSFDSFCNRVKNCSKEKIKNVIAANYYGNNLVWIGAYLVINYYLMYLMPVKYIVLYIFIVVMLTILLMLIMSGHKAGIGVSEDKILFVKMNLFYKVKKIYEIPIDNVKYISYRKFIYNFVNISFIDKMGKFTKLKFIYANSIIGFSLNGQKKNSLVVTKVLKDLQKKLDKGDY